MFGHVSACSGMFRVPGFIDTHFDIAGTFGVPRHLVI